MADTVKARYIGPGIVVVATEKGSIELESGSDQTVTLPAGEVETSTIWEAVLSAKAAKAASANEDNSKDNG